eukprot:CAMPEP_0170645524 /NCGR_PEP_ID=MMETSP0224-20130122/43134_1 /TAXON_ID=285029 /ORGANISM="Togula jolla, Strain CCCM 725" /LENGTH=363 /DNA_ID=CAMNT_0010976763 /DNA_START=59 /DNA_END=1151 /DNA_ORIENTATION=+
MPRPASVSLPHQRRGFAARQSWEAGDDVDLDSVAYGYMASQALFCALELGVFDHIASGAAGASAAAIGEACGISSPRLQTLLTSLVAIKCLRLNEGLYTLSPNTAKSMVVSSRHYYGDYLRYQIGRQFYHTMGKLPEVMTTGKAPNYASWFSDPETAKTYTQAQHNGSVATATYLVKKKLQLGGGISDMLDVGGGSGAFSYVFVGATPGLKSTVLELPEVCRTGEGIRAQQSEDVQSRVSFVELDATSPDWPVKENSFDVVLMSYISGSVPEPIIGKLYANAYKALRSGGRLLVHDFMVDDSLDGPALGALWGLQHVTVNADGLGLCPREIISRMASSGFDAKSCETMEMIHGMTKLIVAHKA